MLGVRHVSMTLMIVHAMPAVTKDAESASITQAGGPIPSTFVLIFSNFQLRMTIIQFHGPCMQ